MKKQSSVRKRAVILLLSVTAVILLGAAAYIITANVVSDALMQSFLSTYQVNMQEASGVPSTPAASSNNASATKEAQTTAAAQTGGTQAAAVQGSTAQPGSFAAQTGTTVPAQDTGAAGKTMQGKGTASEADATTSAKPPGDPADALSFAEKNFITTVVLKKLTASEISSLLGMLQGGLTAEEKKAAKEIAFSRFTQEELQGIYNIYYKYLEQVSP